MRFSAIAQENRNDAPLTTPKAAMAMGANRAAESREEQIAELMDLCRSTVHRVVELTDPVADLQEGVAKLEAR